MVEENNKTGLNKRRTIEELYIDVYNIIVRDKLVTITEITEELNNNWQSNNRACKTLASLGLIKIRMLGGAKVVAFIK